MTKNIFIALVLCAAVMCCTFTGKQDKEDKRLPIANSDSIAKRLDALIKPYIDSGFVGAVLVADPDKIILNKAYGKSKSPLDSSTIFWIASNTKPITAIAIMKLVEEGKLSVKDSLPQFFKNVPTDKTSITIEQLLTHSSGIPDDIAYGERNKEVAIKKILSAKLISKPGEKENYTNNGYELLEVIIELSSKKTYQAFIREAIFAKASMTNSNFVGDDYVVVDPPSDSKTYQPLYEKEFKDGKRAPVLFLGAGGISSNTMDLYKMMVALKGGQILNQTSLSELFKPRTEIEHKGDTILSLAYGWVINTIGKEAEIRHSGRCTWLHNNRIFFLNNGYIVILWAKDNGPDNKAWATEISYPLVKEINLLDTLLTNQF